MCTLRTCSRYLKGAPNLAICVSKKIRVVSQKHRTEIKKVKRKEKKTSFPPLVQCFFLDRSTNIKCAHTWLFFSVMSFFERRARARQKIFIHSVSARHTQFITKLENVHLFEKRVRPGARSHSTSFLLYKQKLFARNT